MSFADRPADASLCPLRILPNDVEVFVGRRESAQLLRLVEKRGLAGADHGAGAVLDEGLAGLHGGVEAVDPGSHLGCLLGGLSGRFHAGELAASILQEALIHRERAAGERGGRFYYGRSWLRSRGGLSGRRRLDYRRRDSFHSRDFRRDQWLNNRRRCIGNHPRSLARHRESRHFRLNRDGNSFVSGSSLRFIGWGAGFHRRGHDSAGIAKHRFCAPKRIPVFASGTKALAGRDAGLRRVAAKAGDGAGNLIQRVHCLAIQRGIVTLLEVLL